MSIYPSVHISSDKSCAFHSFDEHKVNQGCRCYSAEDTNFPFKVFEIVEREDETCDILHYDTEYEGYCHREEDTHHHRQCFVGIDKFRETNIYHTVMCLYHGYRHRCSEKFKYERDRC